MIGKDLRTFAQIVSAHLTAHAEECLNDFVSLRKTVNFIIITVNVIQEKQT